jgi:tetratricopeptide (TPR) repeat protein
MIRIREGKDSHTRTSTRTSAAILFAILFVCLGTVPSQSQATQAAAQSPVASISAELRNHEFAKALALSTAALKKDPRDYRVWTLQGLAYVGMNNPTLAVSSYTRALKLSPDYLPALQGSAEIAFMQRSENAKALLEHLLQIHPGDATAHVMLAVIEYRSHNCSAAVDNFVQAGPAIETQPVALMAYGICLGELNRFDEAISVLQKAVNLQAEDQDAIYNLALVQWNAHRTDDAIKTLQPLVESGAANEDILTLAAEIYESDNDTPRAVELLRKAILQNPRNAEAYLQFATLSYNHASYQVGIDMLNVGLTQLPKDARLYIARGVLYTQLGDSAKGLADFETANRIDPKQPFAGTAEGLVAAQQSNFGQAIEVFRVQAHQNPNNAFTQYLLAEALSNGGKPEDHQQAVDAALLAVKLDPKLVAAHDLLGMLYLQDGKSEQAAAQCQVALDLNPKDQEALYHLVLAIRKTDRKNEIPALMKRLADLKNEDKTEGAQQKRYKLTEEAASPGSPSTR